MNFIFLGKSITNKMNPFKAKISEIETIFAEIENKVKQQKENEVKRLNLLKAMIISVGEIDASHKDKKALISGIVGFIDFETNKITKP